MVVLLVLDIELQRCFQMYISTRIISGCQSNPRAVKIYLPGKKRFSLSGVIGGKKTARPPADRQPEINGMRHGMIIKLLELEIVPAGSCDSQLVAPKITAFVYPPRCALVEIASAVNDIGIIKA